MACYSLPLVFSLSLGKQNPVRRPYAFRSCCSRNCRCCGYQLSSLHCDVPRFCLSVAFVLSTCTYTSTYSVGLPAWLSSTFLVRVSCVIQVFNPQLSSWNTWAHCYLASRSFVIPRTRFRAATDKWWILKRSCGNQSLVFLVTFSVRFESCRRDICFLFLFPEARCWGLQERTLLPASFRRASSSLLATTLKSLASSATLHARARY